MLSVCDVFVYDVFDTHRGQTVELSTFASSLKSNGVCVCFIVLCFGVPLYFQHAKLARVLSFPQVIPLGNDFCLLDSAPVRRKQARGMSVTWK